jgi:S-formylglutathione hydrolase FrmB
VEKPVSEASDEAERWYLGAYGRPFDPAIYKKRNPFSQIEALSRLKRPPDILITTGDDDYFKFHEGSVAMFLALRRAALPAELRVVDGGHDWTVWQKQFPEVIRFIAKLLVQHKATEQ